MVHGILLWWDGVGQRLWPSLEPDQWPSLYDEIDAKWGRSAVIQIPSSGTDGIRWPSVLDFRHRIVIGRSVLHPLVEVHLVVLVNDELVDVLA